LFIKNKFNCELDSRWT